MRSSKSARGERRWFRPLRLEPLEQRVVPSFVAPLTFDAGQKPQSLAVGDFNGDGLLDLAVAGAGGTRVLLGNGDGTFQTTTVGYATGSSIGVAVGDFNGDGLPDLAVTAPVSNLVEILDNDGNLWPAPPRQGPLSHQCRHPARWPGPWKPARPQP
jgi:hypothetical protein